MSDRKYPVGYLVESTPEHPPKTKEELLAKGFGGCDALVVHSIMYPADGSRSEMIFTFDGRTGGELSDKDLFTSWMMTASRLARSETLDEGRRELAKTTFDIFCKAVMSGRNAG